MNRKLIKAAVALGTGTVLALGPVAVTSPADATLLQPGKTVKTTTANLISQCTAEVQGVDASGLLTVKVTASTKPAKLSGYFDHVVSYVSCQLTDNLGHNFFKEQVKNGASITWSTKISWPTTDFKVCVTGSAIMRDGFLVSTATVCA